MITDAHNHLHLLPETRLASYGVDRCVTCGTSPNDWNDAIALAERDTAVKAAIGLHPWQLSTAPAGWREGLSKLLEANPRIAVGEIGLDKTGRSPALAEQIPALREQLALATRLNRPVVLHCVRAYGTLLELLQENALPVCGVQLHAFAGAPEMVPRFAALPCPVYFSISKPDLFPAIPVDRLLVESDASPDNGRSPSEVIAFHRDHQIDPATTAANYSALFGA